jgi:phosphotransferase system enzyme I (PtsI)
LTFSIHGIGVSDKVAIGRAHLLSHVSLEAQHYLITSDQIAAELARFADALQSVQDEFTHLQEQLDADAPVEMSAMLAVHSMIARDELIAQAAQKLISEKRYNAEWALSEQVNELIAQFEAFEDEYLRERKHDVMQVGTRIMRALREHNLLVCEMPQAFDADMILVAHDIAPADMLQFKDRSLAGFITDTGGPNSHTAIVARGLGLPAVVSTGQARSIIRPNEWVIVDGVNGVVLVNPDELILSHYRQVQQAQIEEEQRLAALIGRETCTLDHASIQLMANIESPKDIASLHTIGADGVGLFRSEYLFMNRKDSPDESEQFSFYKSAAVAMQGKPVTIRTLDIGADKELSTDDYETSVNPALGLRAVRYCLAHPSMFLVQIRAILRASHFGAVRLMIPMISGVEQLQQSLRLIEQARMQLRDEGIPFNEQMPVGIMVEIPSAALMLNALLPLIDFVSIGTNDLTQYTLAVDRGDSEVAHLYEELHPAVLQLIILTIRTAQAAGKSVSICGEMAGNAKLTRLFLAMGLVEFSMQKTQILPVKAKILEASIAQSQESLQRILSTYDVPGIKKHIRELNALNMSTLH